MFAKKFDLLGGLWFILDLLQNFCLLFHQGLGPKLAFWCEKSHNCCGFTCLPDIPQFLLLPEVAFVMHHILCSNCYICVSWNRLSKAHMLVCGMNGTTIEVYFVCAQFHHIVIFTCINYSNSDSVYCTETNSSFYWTYPKFSLCFELDVKFSWHCTTSIMFLSVFALFLRIVFFFHFKFRPFLENDIAICSRWLSTTD